jgi:predicted ribonuclease YlaK
MQTEIEGANETILNLIKQSYSWDVRPTKEENIAVLRENINKFKNALQMMNDPTKRENIIVPDTNTLIDHPDIENYCRYLCLEKCTIMLLPTVLSELDDLKMHHREKDMREAVRHVISKIDGIFDRGNPLEGIDLNENVKLKSIAKEPSFKNTLSWLDPNNNDDRILASVLEVQIKYPYAAVRIVTSDINMKNKAIQASIPSLKIKVS